jgi:hypothetical protein
MSSKVITMHFTVDGDGLTAMVQQIYAFEDRARAYSMIDCVNELSSEKKQMILEGEAALTGISVCDKKDCHQCKDIRGKNEMRFVIKQNQKQIKDLYKRNIVTKKTVEKYVQVIVNVGKVQHVFKVKRALLENYCNVITRNEDRIKMINARDIDPYSKQEMVEKVDHNKADAHSRLVRDIGLESKYDDFGQELDEAFGVYYAQRYIQYEKIDEIVVQGREAKVTKGVKKNE